MFGVADLYFCMSYPVPRHKNVQRRSYTATLDKNDTLLILMQVATVTSSHGSRIWLTLFCGVDSALNHC